MDGKARLNGFLGWVLCVRLLEVPLLGRRVVVCIVLLAGQPVCRSVLDMYYAVLLSDETRRDEMSMR